MDEFGTSLPREIAGVGILSDIYAGAVIERALYAAATLGVADVIARRSPQAVEDIAGEVGASAEPLLRVLRLLAARGVFHEVTAGSFANTPASECLRSDVPWSFRWTFLASGFDDAATEIVNVVRTGKSGFERATSRSFWEHLKSNPRAAEEFMAQMRCEARTMSMPLIARYDFAGASHVVDVGGGEGHVLAAALRAAPHLRGTLFEQGAMLTRAQATLERAGVVDRATIVAGDFFTTPLPSGDLYILSRVLHDWDDESAIRILARIRSAIAGDGRVVILEMTLDSGGIRTLASDVLMLTVFGIGRERTREEFANLLRESGFTVDPGAATLTPLQLIVARPA